MTRLHILVEGQTEEVFVKEVLKQHLSRRGVYVEPTLLWTKRQPQGGGFRGGVGNWNQILTNLRNLTKDSGAWVSTLLDFYGLPKDFPGLEETQKRVDVREKVDLLEKRFATELNHKRFIPFLVLHEFEAWLFSAPEIVADHFGCGKLINEMQAIVQDAGSPELINHSETKHPKARLQKLVESFKKSYKPASDGPTLMKNIGIEKVRAACPHFDDWLKQLEVLGSGK